MANRDKILAFFQDTEERMLAAKIHDQAELTTKTHNPKCSDFLDPHGQEIARTMLAQIPAVTGFYDGGYNQAERKRLVTIPFSYLGPPPSPHICALELRGNFQFQKITHRDCLGTITGLGIKRDVIGDIVMLEDGCQVLVDEEIAEFILANMTKIHQVSVKVAKIDVEALRSPSERVKEIKTTLASMRLDTVASAGFSTSRSKMADEIAAERLKVNWKPVRSASYAIKQGDVISMRGRGRVEVVELCGQTKKGRYSVVLKRYL
jgi:photosystem II S4 domain protein